MVQVAGLVVAWVVASGQGLNERIQAEGLHWRAAATRQLAKLPPLAPTNPLEGVDFATYGRTIMPLPAANVLAASVSDPLFSWQNRSGKDFTTVAKDQETCGACFVFASLAAVETQFAIAMDDAAYEPDLSEQEVVSCLTYGNCDAGGFGQEVGNYLKNTGTVDEGCRPYEAANGTCDVGRCSDAANRMVRVVDWHTSIFPPDAGELKELLLAGPVAATMRVYDDLYDYEAGVYERTGSASFMGWHMVELVGWDDGDHSFIAKNSWGTAWGDRGFFKISQDDDCDTFMTEGVCFAANAVTFDVSPSEAPPFPCVEPLSLTITSEVTDDPLSRQVTISNCGGKTLQWHALSLPADVTLLPMSSGSLALGAAQPLTFTLDPADFTPGTHNLTLPFASQLGDVANLNVTFKVTYTPPAVAFSTSVTGGVAPLTVVFTNMTSGEAQAFAWEFGDGTTSAVVSPVHTYVSAGEFTVKLSATHLLGVASRTQVLTITAPPVTPVDPGATDPNLEGGSAEGGCAALPVPVVAPWAVPFICLAFRRRHAQRRAGRKNTL